MKSRTYAVEIPLSLEKLIERRTRLIIAHYFKVDGVDVQAIARSAYLQGVSDGCDVGEKLAMKEFGFNAS